MMLGLATATIVESSKIMKKPTIIAHSACHGFRPSACFVAGPPPPDRRRAVAVVISSPHSTAFAVASSPGYRGRRV